MENSHLPLPDAMYARLRAESERLQVPVTTLAREAIDQWLRQRARTVRHEAIAEYAAPMAGTQFDLDPALEAAGVEHLRKTTSWPE